MALLEIKGLSKHFGGVIALEDLDMEVREGEILGLIGPNGAGKSTFFNVVCGVYQPTEGRVFFKGEDITGLRPDQVCKKGMTRTFQATNLFHERTVLDNIVQGYYMQQPGFWVSVFNPPSTTKREEELRQQAMVILEMMGMADLKDEYAKNLPHGHQRILGCCLALATQPQLLLLDEPMTGMNAEETVAVVEGVRGLRDRGITLLVVEHNMRAVMGLCDRIVVLNFGRKIAEGSPEEIRENPEVINAYLGTVEAR